MINTRRLLFLTLPFYVVCLFVFLCKYLNFGGIKRNKILISFHRLIGRVLFFSTPNTNTLFLDILEKKK